MTLLRAMLVALAVTAVAAAPAASALDAPASAAAKKKPKKKKKCKAAATSAKGKKKKKKKCAAAEVNAEIRISPDVFNFGTVMPPASPETVFNVTNKGTAASGNIAIKLEDRSTFQGNAAPLPPLAISANTCSATLPPGGSCTITIKFTPLLPGVNGAAVLSIGANPGGSQSSSVFGQS